MPGKMIVSNPENVRQSEDAINDRRFRDYIPQTPFWKLARGRVVPVVEIVVLPLSLLEAFHRTKDPRQDWGYLMRFLSPLTVASGPLIKMT
jgi:hypothetical protein